MAREEGSKEVYPPALTDGVKTENIFQENVYLRINGMESEVKAIKLLE